MNKKELTEADIRTKYSTPALVGVGVGKWNVMTQVREEISLGALQPGQGLHGRSAGGSHPGLLR